MSQSYEIGYRRPPRHSKWKPGQSGNPHGRKRGAKSGNTILNETLLEKITIRKDGVPMRVTKLEAMFLKMLEMALKGDVKAFMTLFDLAQKHGEFEPKQTSVLQIEFVDADPKNFGKFGPLLEGANRPSNEP